MRCNETNQLRKGSLKRQDPGVIRRERKGVKDFEVTNPKTRKGGGGQNRGKGENGG